MCDGWFCLLVLFVGGGLLGRFCCGRLMMVVPGRFELGGVCITVFGSAEGAEESGSVTG